MSEELITYSKDGLTLLSVPAQLTEITIKSVATHIKGGEGEGAFLNAKQTLQNVYFEAGSNLIEFPPFCFSSFSQLKFVDISKCTQLQTISDDAFSYCPLLTSIPIPSTVTSIGKGAFQGSGLTSFRIPASVETIGSHLLYYCSSLTSFEIDNESPLLDIAHHCLTGTPITNLKISKSLKFCSGSNFEFCTQLATIEVDPANQHLEAYENVLYSKGKTHVVLCAAAKTGVLELPASTIDILSCSFHSSQLTKVVLTNISAIRSYAFYGSKLETISFPESLSKLEIGAFGGCLSLREVSFSEGLEIIGPNCFDGCQLLKDVTLPSTIKILGGAAFKGCSPDLKLKFHANSSLEVDNNLYIITDKSIKTLFQCLSENESLEIPATITSISQSAFNGIETIKHITFQANSELVSIEATAFSGCLNLATFAFPESLQIIASSAFKDCYLLGSVSFGTQLTKIDETAFQSCVSIDSITFSETSNVTIGKSAFIYCSKIREIVGSKAIFSIEKSAFEGCSNLLSIELPAKISYIGMYAFRSSGLTSCTFEPNCQLYQIETRTFYDCVALETFVFPDHIDKIGAYAFCNTLLSNIDIPSSVSLIKENCFENCKKLVSFHIPSDSELQKFELNVFLGCDSFSTINCDEGCVNFVLDNFALYNKNKTELVILPPNSPVKYFSFPDTLETVGICALQGCQNLELIFIPYSIKVIKANAFCNCINLHLINIPHTVETIESNAFLGCKNIVCGVAIESADNKTFVDNLVKVAKLPAGGLKSCRNIVTCNNKNNTHFSFLFSVVLAGFLSC